MRAKPNKGKLSTVKRTKTPPGGRAANLFCNCRMDRVPLIPSGGAIKASSPGTKAELYEVKMDSFRVFYLEGPSVSSTGKYSLQCYFLREQPKIAGEAS